MPQATTGAASGCPRRTTSSTAAEQHVAGDGEFVGRCPGIAKGVVEDEIFEMDKLAVDPKGGTRICVLRPFEEAGAGRRAGDALVETGRSDTCCGFYFEVSNWKSSLGC